LINEFLDGNLQSWPNLGKQFKNFCTYALDKGHKVEITSELLKLFSDRDNFKLNYINRKQTELLKFVDSWHNASPSGTGYTLLQKSYSQLNIESRMIKSKFKHLFEPVCLHNQNRLLEGLGRPANPSEFFQDMDKVNISLPPIQTTSPSPKSPVPIPESLLPTYLTPNPSLLYFPFSLD
jgi:hypothetical protein